jgi:hypothetical protein
MRSWSLNGSLAACAGLARKTRLARKPTFDRLDARETLSGMIHQLPARVLVHAPGHETARLKPRVSPGPALTTWLQNTSGSVGAGVTISKSTSSPRRSPARSRASLCAEKQEFKPLLPGDLLDHLRDVGMLGP